MARTSKFSAPRWTFTVPPEKSEPRGNIECARKALARLGPFRHRRQDDADRLGPFTAFHGRQAVSEELAAENIMSLAVGFLEQEELSRNAPRIKDVFENLTALEHLAGLLSAFLEGLDDFTRSYLQTAGTGIGDYTQFISNPVMERADVPAFPQPADEDNYPCADTWIGRIRAIEEYASLSRRNFMLVKDIRDEKKPDKGGSSNLYKHLYGTPQWNLVSGGWYIFEMFKPGKATGTEGGEFHLFLMDVYEFATGRDPEKLSSILKGLKSVPRIQRRMKELTDQQLKLIDEQCSLDRWQLGAAEWTRRDREVELKLLAVQQEKQELWAYLFPYTYGYLRNGTS